MAKRKVWVLDTETKGTGAQMVPLDSVAKRPPAKEHLLPPGTHRPKPDPAPADAPRAPRRFKVVDIASRRVLAEDAGLRATLDVLRDQRSSVDVNVYVWEPERDDWRLLTLGERKLLWERR